MAKESNLEFTGEVIDSLPNANFRVRLDGDDHQPIILCHISGKIRKNFVRILPGDKVTVAMSPYDTTKGRITVRH